MAEYPAGAKRQQVATGAVEPIWLSSTELLYRSSVTWYKVQIDPASGEPVGDNLLAESVADRHAISPLHS